jgi:hypothetical protein
MSNDRSAKSRKRLQVQMDLHEQKNQRPRWAGLQNAVQDDVVGLLARLLLASASAADEQEECDG